MPRQHHRDYLLALETMNKREARRLWREGIKRCWDDRCAFCNGVPIDDKSLTLDHVKPRSKGGQDLTSNLVPACTRCNTNKGSSDWRQWYRLQSFYCPVREAEISAWLAQGDRHLNEWWDIGMGDLEWCLDRISNQAA